MLVIPSSSRSLAKREGRCLRELKGGSTLTDPPSRTVAWRAASRSGPNERMVTCAALRSPRRNGVSEVVSERRSPAGTVSACRAGVAPADGGQPSRTVATSRRLPVLVTNSVALTVSPSRTGPGSSRASDTFLGEPAMMRSRVTSAMSRAIQNASVMGSPVSTIGMIPSAVSATNHPETAIARSAPEPAALSTSRSSQQTRLQVPLRA